MTREASSKKKQKCWAWAAMAQKGNTTAICQLLGVLSADTRAEECMQLKLGDVVFVTRGCPDAKGFV